MSSSILSFDLTPFEIQSGYGIPNHISNLGSEYTDLNTGLKYMNKDGINTWVLFLDGSMNGLIFTGGTVNGKTIFTGGLSANTISATTYFNLPEPQIIITTSASVTTLTTDVNGLSQHGKAVVIDNGANAINLTTDINSEAKFIASYLKHGVSGVTFVQGSGTTLIQVDGTAAFSGAVGSTATLQRVSNTFYLRISNV